MGARGAVSPIITDFEQRICVVLILEEVAMRKKKPIRSDMGWSTSERIVVCGLDLTKQILGKVSLGDMAWLEIKGSLPSPQQSAVFNAMLVTLVEHGMTPMAIATRLTYLGAPESLQGAVASGLLGMGTTFAGTAEGAARTRRGPRAGAPAGMPEEDPPGLADTIVKRLRESRQPIPGIGHNIHKP